MVALSLKLGKFIHEVEALPLTEVIEYLAYNRLDPFTEDREDFRAAMLAMVVNRSAGGKSQLRDFMPRFGKPKEIEPEVAAKMLEQFARMHNARIEAQQKKGEPNGSN